MAKEGSTVSGLMDSFATAVSLALQYGVPLKVLCDKFSHTRFEPSGWTPTRKSATPSPSWITSSAGWPQVPARDAQPREDASVQSLNGTEAERLRNWPRSSLAPAPRPPGSGIFGSSMSQGGLVGVNQSDDAPSCADCGAIMVRNGACYKCLNCGSTSGCS
jgi:ribonucleoside-diphosphate reductase alpha chain